MTEVILLEAAGSFTHVAVRGKLDAAGVGEVDVRLTSQTVSRRKPAIIDLGDVGFIASLGIGMLVAIARSMRGHGAGLVVVAGSTPVRSVLEMANIGHLVPLAATRDEALEMLGIA